MLTFRSVRFADLTTPPASQLCLAWHHQDPTAMFEVPHNHHGKDFKRFFSPGRSSMSAIEDKRADEFRKHVWAVTMIDEDPLSGKMNRHSTDLV